MKVQIILVIYFLLVPTLASAAEPDVPNERIARVQSLFSAAENTPMNQAQLLNLCRGVDGVRWCEGYISAILTVYQIPRSCLPVTDMAPFMNGQVWELATTWILKQPQGSTVSFFDAVTNALAEQTTCPMTTMIPFGGPELIPLSNTLFSELARGQDLIPLENVVPIYPPAAKRDGIEGWVLVSFTVTEAGGVKDIMLVDAEPANIFNEASIDAAAKLTYKPTVRNGVAVPISNVQHVFRFAP